MSDFMAGFLLGAWTVGIIAAVAWWIGRSLAIRYKSGEYE